MYNSFSQPLSQPPGVGRRPEPDPGMQSMQQFGNLFGQQAQQNDFLKRLQQLTARGGQAEAPGQIQSPAGQPGMASMGLDYPQVTWNQPTGGGSGSGNIKIGGGGTSSIPNYGGGGGGGGTPPMQYPQLGWDNVYGSNPGGTGTGGSGGGGGGGTSVTSGIKYGGVVDDFYDPDSEEENYNLW